MKIKPFILLLTISFLEVAFGGWEEEKEKIDNLILEIRTSNGTFIRNGQNHTAQEAADHLNGKLKRALSSWFTPPKKNWSATLFINEIASKSSWSGKPYQIKINGKVRNTGDWLKEKLRKLENQNSKTGP